jgi:3-methyladenine DNA glycosylase AlkD
MAAKKRSQSAAPSARTPVAPTPDVAEVLAELKHRGRKATRDGMARYAIPSANAFGVPVGELRSMGKRLGKSHALAAALWQSGHYEARMLATFVDEAEQVTAPQMDRWCKDFDNWAICDTACFALFDRTPHAFKKVEQWAKSESEFVKRAAFALLASLSLHDKAASDAAFLRTFAAMERAAQDERNFVKKAVSWALRSVGERNLVLHRAAIELAERLAAGDAAPRWVGKDALRGLKSAAVQRRLARKKASKA